MSTLDDIRTTLSDILSGFLAFWQEDERINHEITLLDHEIRQEEDKAKILETLHHIDKL